MANSGLNELAQVCKLISKLNFPEQGAKIKRGGQEKVHHWEIMLLTDLITFSSSFCQILKNGK